MAALTIAAGLATAALAPGARASGDEKVVNTVRLELKVAGLGPKGCDVEIKPGHAACRFATVKKHVDPGGKLPPLSIVAESVGADHDCSFAITVTEPGRPPKTYRRGLPLSTAKAGGKAPTQSLTVYVSSPTLAAKESKPGARKR
jgi:hypothetical protein